MNRHWLVLFALVLLFSGGAKATLITYTAELSGPAEAPPNASPGTGSVTVTYDSDFQTLLVDVTFSGLIGNTTAAHIHCCTGTPGAGTVGVATMLPSFTAFPLGVTSGTYHHSFDLYDPVVGASFFNPAFFALHGGTVDGARAALLAGLSDGKAYFNIHTNQFPGGEIRGFLARVPEPATLSLLGLGFGTLLAAKRKERVVP